MEPAKLCNQVYTFCYQGQNYQYVITKVLKHPHPTCRIKKGVYLVRFQDGLPGTAILPHTDYCLKEVVVDHADPSVVAVPGARDYWDLVSFVGIHLRNLIALDDNAAVLAQELVKSKEPGRLFLNQRNVYTVLEPCYIPLSKYLRDHPQITARERLDILIQTCCGLLELYRNSSKEGSHSIWKVDIHRDVKTANLVLQVLSENPRRHLVMLEDFATIRMADDRTADASPSGGTNRDASFSPDNSSPESFLYQKPGFAISQKMDVFAVGTLMGELFGCRNPLILLGQKEGGQDFTTALYGAYSALYEQGRYGEGPRWHWLEECLGHSFTWDKECPGMNPQVLAGIQALFREMTAFQPCHRCDMATALHRLTPLDRLLEPRRRVKALLLDLRDIQANRGIYQVCVNRILEGSGEDALARVILWANIGGKPLYFPVPERMDASLLQYFLNEDDYVGTLPADAAPGNSLENALEKLAFLLKDTESDIDAVHILSPRYPGPRTQKGKPMDALVQSCCQAANRALPFFCHSLEGTPADWYTPHTLRGASLAGAVQPRSPRPQPQPEPQRVPPQPKSRAVPSSTPSPAVFHTGHGALCVKDAGGKIHFVGKIVR